MKRICILVFLLVCACRILQAQADDGLGHFTEAEIRERDAINQQVQSQRNWQNDCYYQQLSHYQYNPQLYQKVNITINQAQHGL